MRLKVRTLTPSRGVSARTRLDISELDISELVIGRTWVRVVDRCRVMTAVVCWFGQTERQTDRQGSKQVNVNRRTGRQADSQKDDDGVKDDE